MVAPRTPNPNQQPSQGFDPSLNNAFGNTPVNGTAPPSIWDQLIRGLFAPGGLANNPYGVPSNAGLPSWMAPRPPSAVPSGASVGSLSPLDILQQGQAGQWAQPPEQPQQSVQDQVNQAAAAGYRTDPNNPSILYGPAGEPYAITANGIVPITDPMAVARLQGQQAQQQLQQQGQNAVDLANAQGQNTLALGQLQGQNAVTLQDLVNQGQIGLAQQQGTNAIGLQGAQTAGTLAVTALQGLTQQSLQQLQNDAAERLAHLQADNSLSLSDKETQRTQITTDMQGRVAEIQTNGLLQAHQIDAELGRYQSQLEQQTAQLQEQTKRYLGDQQYDLGLKNLATQSQIEHEKRIIEEERNNLDGYIANLQNQTAQRGQNVNLLGTVLGLQSAERQQRTKSAVDFFGQLAQLAPQQNLVNAFFTMRGQAPPPSLASQAIPQLSAIMGLSPQQTGAIIQASGINNQTVAPFLQDLFGVKAAPTNG